MLTIAVYSPEGDLLAYNINEQDADTFRRQGLIVKMIKQPHIELMDDGAEEENG